MDEQAQLRLALLRHEELLQGLNVLEALDDVEPLAGLDELCVRTLHLLSSAGFCQNCSIMFLGDDGQYLHLYAAASPAEPPPVFLPPGAWPGKRFRRGEGVAGHVVLTGLPFFSNDVQLSPEFAHVPDATPVGALICLPLQYEGQTFGVLNMSHAMPGVFSNELAACLRLAARRCGRLLSHPLRNRRHDGDNLYNEFFQKPKRDGMIVFDLYGRVREANPAVTLITGYPLKRLMDSRQLWSNLVEDAGRSRVEAHRERVRSTGEADQIEYQFYCADGSLLLLREATFPLFDEYQRCSGFLGVISEAADASASDPVVLQSEAQLRQAQKIQALGELASGVAHDLNNLLTGVLGHIDLAMLCNNLPEVLSLLGEAQRAGLRGADLLHKLLAFGHLSQSEKRAVNLGQLMDEVTAICSTFNRRYEITVSKPPQLHGVTADPGQLHQLLLNLCLNARDALEAAEAQEPDRDLQLVLGAENVIFNEQVPRPWPVVHPGLYVRLYVMDTGVGMDPRTQARIYEPFFTTKPEGKGTGLGLATVYRIVRQHDGYIDIETEPGRGSVFSIYLRARPHAHAQPAPPRTTQELPGGTETILLVDDEEMVRSVGSAILKRLGYRVLLAEDGIQAVQTYITHAGKIDLTILDVAMPRLTGTEALRRIRDHDPRACIVLSSGYQLQNEEHLPAKYLPNALLKKPYLLHVIARLLRDVLDARRVQ